MTTTKFDITDYLDREEMVAEFLLIVLENGESADFLVAIGHITKAIGMTEFLRKQLLDYF